MRHPMLGENSFDRSDCMHDMHIHDNILLAPSHNMHARMLCTIELNHGNVGRTVQKGTHNRIKFDASICLDGIEN